jgi:precorrin-6B methylase 2
MSNSLLERLLSTLQTLVFKQVGKKITTNSLKNLMDPLFIIFEKAGCKFEVISEIYLKLYQEIVIKEITMAQISPQDRVLVIGSGSLPATPVLIAQNTHAQIVSIDKDSTAVNKAAHYVKSHHLEQTLTIECADGLTYPLEQFTIVFVLYGVKKPAEMLRSIADRINQNTKVIYRAITDSQGRVTDKTLQLTTYFTNKDQVHSETLGSFDSFLLTKK